MREHGVDGLALRVRGAGGGHIRPGRQQHQRARQQPAALAQTAAQRQRQIAARAVADHGHIPCAVAQIHQVVPGAQGVFQCGGIGVLGGQTIVEGEHVVARDVGQLGGQHAGVAQIAAGVAAAVAIEDHMPPLVGMVQPHPGGLLCINGCNP